MTHSPQLASLTFYGDALLATARAAKLNAANIANADTPHYKARGIDFATALEARLQGDPPAPVQYMRGLPTGLDGNDVSLDYESVQSAENSQRMRESLTFLTNEVHNLLTALQPEGSSSSR